MYPNLGHGSSSFPYYGNPSTLEQMDTTSSDWDVTRQYPNLTWSEADPTRPIEPPLRSASSGSSSGSSSQSRHPSASPPSSNVVTSIALDTEWLAVAFSNSTISIYSVRTGEHMRSLKGHKQGVWALALVSRGGRPYAGVSSEEERDHYMRSGIAGESSRLIYEGRRSDPSGSSEGWGQRASAVVSGGSDRVVAVWDTVTGKCNHALQGHAGTIRCLKTLHNRPVAISGSRDATLRVWDINKGRLITVLRGHTGGISAMDVCGNRCVSGSYDATCRIWNVDSSECLQILTGHTGRIYSVSFDGARIASGGMDATTRVWDARTGVCLRSLSSSKAAVLSLQISPSTYFLAAAASDGTVTIYSLSTYQIMQHLSSHKSSITALQFMPSPSSSSSTYDGGMTTELLSAGNDGWVRRFDVETSRYMREFCPKSENVWKVGATRDGFCAVVCQREGKTVVEIWSNKRKRGGAPKVLV